MESSEFKDGSLASERLAPEKWIDIPVGAVLELDRDGSIDHLYIRTPDPHNERMTYDAQSGVIARVDADGRFLVAPDTKTTRAALRDAGYKGGSLPVPFINGALPVDPEIRAAWLEQMAAARAETLADNQAEHLAFFQSRAEQAGLKPVTGEWLTVDGLEINNDDGSRNMTIPVNTDGNQMAAERLDDVGLFHAESGVLAFVDGEGHLRVGPDTAQRRALLEDAGYKPGSFAVPLTRGQRPADEDAAERWRAMLQ